MIRLLFLVSSGVAVSASCGFAASPLLTEQVLRPGDQARPLLVANVMLREYDGPVSSVACTARERQLERTIDAEIAKVPVCEGVKFGLCGLTGVWRLCETPPPVYTDGKYYTTEKESIGLAALTLVSPRVQKIMLRVRDFGRQRVYLNGHLAAQTEECRHIGGPVRPKTDRRRGDPIITWSKVERKYANEHGGQWRNGKTSEPRQRLIPLSLEKGTNVIHFARAKVGRYTSFSFACALESAADVVQAVLPCVIPQPLREAVAQSRSGTYLGDDVWMAGDKPRIHIGQLSAPEVELDVKVRQDGRAVDIPRSDVGGGWHEFPPLEPAGYAVRVEWKAKDGRKISSADFSFQVFAPCWRPDPGVVRFDVRRQMMLESLAKRGDPLALYRLGRIKEIEGKGILEKCLMIGRRADCAEFELLPLLWLVWEDRRAHLLPTDITDQIRRAALSFRYWIDEPGNSSMCYCSENHRISFHACEYLAGILYPNERFSLSDQNGLYHALKGRMHLMEWLSQRCKFGFDEPMSDSYMPVTLTALLTLHEVVDVDEYPIRNMTDALLDFMAYTFAVASFDGCLAAPRSRSYGKPLRSRLCSSMSGVLWMLFGNAPGEGCHRALACSFYRPPVGVLELADVKEPVDFSFCQGLMHVDRHNADFVLRRTADYFVGGVREHNVGIRDKHFTPMSIVLGHDIPIFFQACDNNAHGAGFRPDYWSGNASLPRVLPFRRTLFAIWHDVANRDIMFTHCHFPKRRFDEVRREGGWTFGRSGKGYVGVWSDVPHTFLDFGDFAFRELRAPGREVIWLAECGSEQEDGSFADFRLRLLSGSPKADAKGVVFVSPLGGKIEVGRKDGFLVDGRPVPISKSMAESPYFHANYGGGKFEFTCPNFQWTEWTYPATE